MTTAASTTSDPSGLSLERLHTAFDAAAAAAGAEDAAAEAIDAALEVIHDELGDACVAAFVLEHGRLWSVGVRGYAMIPDGLSLEEGIIGRAARTCEIQFVPDVAHDPDFIGVSEHVVSELAIPLSGPTGVVGVLDLETRSRLPAGSDVAAARLMRALNRPIGELRASRTVDLSTLARLFVHMSSLRDPQAIAEVAVRSLGRVLPLESSRLALLDDAGHLVESAEWSAAGPAHDSIPLSLLEALRSRIETSALLELFDASTADVPELRGRLLRSVVLIPLRANGSELGVLAGASRFPREFDRGQGELAALLAAHTAASLDAAIALDRERRSAHTDPLTGLLNRRGIEDGLERELAAAQEVRRPLSLAVLDLDDLKEVNDRAGHQFGDALLREVGLVLGNVSPANGLAGRMGGDEFVIALPGVAAEEAVDVVERLRAELGSGLDEGGFPVRLCAGISTYPYDGDGTTQLLRAADQALFQAKALGKNRVMHFGEIVRGAGAGDIASVRPDRGTAGAGVDPKALADVTAAAAAIWAEQTPEAVLDRLTRSISFLVGATATAVSRVEGERLCDAAVHSLREVQIRSDETYLIADYPVTREVLETPCVRSMSFLDGGIDSSEAFILRELQMNAVMLLPLRVEGRSWGLVEVYDMRMRRFSAEDEAVAAFVVDEAGRRLELLGNHGARHLLRRLAPRHAS